MTRPLAALLLLLLMLAATTAHSNPPDDIHTFLDRFVAAFDNLEWPTFTAMFEDDATVFYPSPPNAAIRATGRHEYEAAWQKVFNGIRGTRTTPPFMDLHPERLEIQQMGDVAVVTFELHDIPNVTGRRTLILHRRDGKWRITHLHASNVPST
jgi:ketosteroid isomerase-like protein